MCMLFGNVAKCMWLKTVACRNNFLKQPSFSPCAFCFALRKTGEQGNKGNGHNEMEAYLCFLLISGVPWLAGCGSVRSAGTRSVPTRCPWRSSPGSAQHPNTQVEHVPATALLGDWCCQSFPLCVLPVTSPQILHCCS